MQTSQMSITNYLVVFTLRLKSNNRDINQLKVKQKTEKFQLILYVHGMLLQHAFFTTF